MTLEQIASGAYVTVRRAGAPDPDGGCVVYWMQRAQRARDNPALDVAVDAANALGLPAVAFFAPVPYYPNANLRHYRFLAEGIPDIAAGLAKRGVGFVLRRYPDHSLLRFVEEVRPALVVGDENPVRDPEAWRAKAERRLRVSFWTVDADVIVPTKLFAKEHYAARTLRPRIRERLPEFLVSPRNPRAQVGWKRPRGLLSLPTQVDLTAGWAIDRSLSPVSGFRGGTGEGLRRLREFVRHRLPRYTERRNRPQDAGTSELSPYLHFGHLGPHTVALAVMKSGAPQGECDAFLEQLIVRRELAINFVRCNPAYDSIECAAPWAQRTLAAHARDPRPVLYSEKQLEQAETHDPLWNAAQRQMVSTGWMHNYLRMYWAKKILEWSTSPAVAYQVAVRLNDKYELDGRDANGYAGVAWAIAGKHDRPWFERPIFGTVRYMSGASTGRKFDSRAYIEQHGAD